MSSEPAIVLTSVSKVYDRSAGGVRWRTGVPWLDEDPRQPHAALKGLDLRVDEGEALGIIGPNGAGKSTILKLVAGVTHPTTGSVRCRGRIGSMIELAVGFHPDLTGAENIRCSGVMRGASRREIDDAFTEIVDFAGIESAMSSPVKTYSLGMRARLAFALATQFPVEILAVDEVLAVGDHEFQEQCLQRIERMVASGVTLLFVSHEMTLVTQVCSRVLHLRDGKLVDDGVPREVVERYLSRSPSSQLMDPQPRMHIRACRVPDEIDSWEALTVTAEVDVTGPVRRPVVGVDLTLPTVAPDHIYASSMVPLPGLGREGRYRVRGTMPGLPLEGADIRLALSLLDDVKVADVARSDYRVRGGLGRPRFTMEPIFTIEPSAEPPGSTTDQHPTHTSAGPAVVRVDGVVKTYPRGRLPANFRAALPGRLGRVRPGEVRALDHIEFAVRRGEALGVIGPNGAGKSTLLRLLAGLVQADCGEWTVDGHVIPMLDVGAGLHPELSGRENLRVGARILGMGQRELDRQEAAILAFAGIGEAIDAPVRQYSTGMRARLGFALAVHLRGEVLVIDEILAVGDEDFRRSALDVVLERRRAGATILFVSHELQLVEQLCDRVLRLDHGRVLDDGPAATVIDAYAGSSWAGGTHDATSAIRLTGMTLTQRHIPVGGTLEMEAEVVVDEPSSSARLDVSYRMPPEDRSVSLTPSQREAQSFYLRTLEPSGGALSRAGRHRCRLRIDRHDFAGGFDVVLSVVDDQAGIVLSETWSEVVVGSVRPEGFPGPILRFSWEAIYVGGEGVEGG